MLALTHAAIRSGRARVGMEDTLTLAELRAALHAVRDVEDSLDRHPVDQAPIITPPPRPVAVEEVTENTTPIRKGKGE